MTFFKVTGPPSAYLRVQVRVETKTPSLVQLDPAHQALIDRMLEMKENGMNCRQIANHLNDEGVTSWTGKRFYPELVFGAIRKAKIKAKRTGGSTERTERRECLFTFCCFQESASL